MSSEKEFLKEFIEIYKSFPCLWKRKDLTYLNVSKKNAAYNCLLEKLIKVEPHATIKTVTRKINSLRSAYRKERRKVLQSLNSGVSPSEIYEPSLWYYNLLDFLHDQGNSRQGITKSESYLDDLEENSEDSEQCSNIPIQHYVDTVTSWPDIEKDLSTQCFTANIPKRRRNTEDSSEKMMDLVANMLHETNEVEHKAHSAFGAHVSEELRAMPQDMVPIVKKLINDAIFEGHMRSLNRHSRVQAVTNEWRHDHLNGSS